MEQIKVRWSDRSIAFPFECSLPLQKRIHERQNTPGKQQKKAQASPKKHTQQPQVSINHRQKVLLGYDFVAGLLDNDKASLLNDDNHLSDSYLDELVSFRKTNLDQSTSSYALSKCVRLVRH